MEKIQHVRKPEPQPLPAATKQEPRHATAVQWGEQEILALQEKARRHQRRYPSGGYQGL